VTPAALRLRLRSLGDRLGALDRRRDRAASVALQRARTRLSQAARLVDSLSLKAILDRGFALVHDPAGGLIKRANEVQPGAPIEVQFADGRIGAVADGGGGTAGEPGEEQKAKPRAASPMKKPEGQGTLF
ncbi:MAG: exodeoxyribonuclease VII large subunit, partial [Mesorhizobium sp.]|nr:exodeoxyribonuclease VII large subunit [Mesorhizobium sp.]